VRRAVTIGLAALLGCASEITAVGYAAVDARAFPEEPRYHEQSDAPGFSLVAEPELFLKSEDNTHALSLRPFLRLDSVDPQRTHGDLRRADYVLSVGDFELGAGSGQFRWGVLEAHSPSEVLNTPDEVDDLARSAKLGQPYVELAFVPGDWAVRLYALPYARAAQYPGERGRLRFANVVSTTDVLYETALGPWQPSFAARFSATVGSLDLGLGAFTGVSREARFVAQLTDRHVVPAYDLIHQASFDLAWSGGGLDVHLELMGRLWSRELHFLGAAGVGLEYTFSDLFGTDLTLVSELHLDSRPNEAPVTIFDHDVFLGLRWALNDEGGTQLLGGVVLDVIDLRAYVRVEAAHRFGEHWKLSLQLNGYFGVDGPLESGLLRDNHGQLRLAYYF
jgi:hypothetical protein